MGPARPTSKPEMEKSEEGEGTAAALSARGDPETKSGAGKAAANEATGITQPTKRSSARSASAPLLRDRCMYRYSLYSGQPTGADLLAEPFRRAAADILNGLGLDHVLDPCGGASTSVHRDVVFGVPDWGDAVALLPGRCLTYCLRPLMREPFQLLTNR